MFTRFHNSALLTLSYVCVYLRVSIYVCVYLPFAASVYAYIFVVYVHIYQYTCTYTREIRFICVYFLLVIPEFNPFDNFSFKIINIIK